MLKEMFADSLGSFVQQVGELCDLWREDERASPWFRGQADARWSLIPRVYRFRRISERSLRTEFRRRAVPLLVAARALHHRPTHSELQ